MVLNSAEIGEGEKLFSTDVPEIRDCCYTGVRVSIRVKESEVEAERCSVRFLRASKTGGHTYWRVVEAIKEGRWPKYKTVLNLGRHESREAAQAAWDARVGMPRTDGMTQEEASPIEQAFADLGLSSAANPEQVRAAYRRLAAANHPDRGGNPDAMVQINQAYEQAMATLDREDVEGPNAATA